MLGRRYRIAASSPCATAASAGNSQLPRWLAKISAGLPSCRSCANSSWVRGAISMRLSSGCAGIVVPDVIEMGEFGADAAEIVPDAGQNGLDLLAAIFPGNAAVRLARPIRCSRSVGPIRRVIAAEQIGGLDRIEIAGGAQHARSSARRRRLRRAAWSASRRRALVRSSRRMHQQTNDDLPDSLDRFARQDQRGVLAAEAERIRHHRGDAGVARLVGNHVERESPDPECRS